MASYWNYLKIFLKMTNFVLVWRQMRKVKSFPRVKLLLLTVIGKHFNVRSFKKLQKVDASTKQNLSSTKSWMLERNIKRICIFVSILIYKKMSRDKIIKTFLTSYRNEATLLNFLLVTLIALKTNLPWRTFTFCNFI